MPNLQARQHTQRVRTLERDGATLLFKNVPADICDNCGEIYHDEEVTRSLLEQAEQASTRGVELDVRRYAAE